MGRLSSRLLSMQLELLKKWDRGPEPPASEAIHRALRSLRNLDDWIDIEAQGDPRSFRAALAGFRDNYRRLVTDAARATQSLAAQVADAIERTDDWRTWPVTVSPSLSSEHYFDPPGTFHVRVGSSDAGFTIFSHGEAVTKDALGDVLEGGDPDFFTDAIAQRDYFALVKELGSPGSSSRGRVLTLYTARPVHDRGRYEGTASLPVNIFLTRSLDDAEGIAHDLGGHGVRDVWRVRIDSRYLVETLDSPGVRQYQTVGEGEVPVRSIALVGEGGEREPRANPGSLRRPRRSSVPRHPALRRRAPRTPRRHR
jgi:hypothetical protein